MLASCIAGLGLRRSRRPARFSGLSCYLAHASAVCLWSCTNYTNAVKYGALCTEDGEIILEWDHGKGTVELTWREVGQPCKRDSTRTGFGERMIAMTVKSDLHGTVEREWHPQGLIVKLRFPLGS